LWLVGRKEGQFGGINALMTSQVEDQWRMDIRIWNRGINGAKVVFSKGLGISELSVGGEDFTINRFEIFLT